MLSSYSFVEQFGHGRAASRNARIDEVDIDDSLNDYTYRLRVMPGCTKEEAAREFLNNSRCPHEGQGRVLCADRGCYWIEAADDDLWNEVDDNCIYDLASHPNALTGDWGLTAEEMLAVK